VIAAAFGLVAAVNLYQGERRSGLAFLILAAAWLVISFTKLGAGRSGSAPPAKP
jgi:hypothetical protein